MPEGDPIKWVSKDAFVMPSLPEELAIDPVLAALLHCMAFLDLSADDTVDPDWAVEAMECATAYLLRLAPEDASQIQEQLDRVAHYSEQQGFSGKFVEFVREFLRSSGVGENEDEA